MLQHLFSSAYALSLLSIVKHQTHHLQSTRSVIGHVRLKGFTVRCRSYYWILCSLLQSCHLSCFGTNHAIAIYNYRVSHQFYTFSKKGLHWHIWKVSISLDNCLKKCIFFILLIILLLSLLLFIYLFIFWGVCVCVCVCVGGGGGGGGEIEVRSMKCFITYLFCVVHSGITLIA